jgi:hypothetical protein
MGVRRGSQQQQSEIPHTCCRDCRVNVHACREIARATAHAPHTFLAHHRAAISAAVVLADATTILLAAPAMSFKLTMGMSPF